ncbi:WAT1-related protein At5g40240-like [Ziziphus jujuba]|uniref:WAT1-related protein At5g40240-like n=1 Tax=Ziziphus jujuba TaxID=326968 RepID=A0ABM3ZXA4_ZIZJJ|nr:WAT1-related protein At5g40240-like [Ziziphus jujuba]
MAGGMENIGRFVGIAMVVLAQVRATSTQSFCPFQLVLNGGLIGSSSIEDSSLFPLLRKRRGFGLLMGNAGLQYSSVTLNSAMLNLIPAFTFLLALAFRMEKLKLKSSSSQAKSLGTLVSIAEAFVVTFYKGSPIIKARTLFVSTHQFLVFTTITLDPWRFSPCS